MSVPATTIRFYPLRRFDSPQYLLGAGFLAGLLVFCVWLWSVPSHGRHAVHARGNGQIGASAVEPGAGGVLSGITGESGRAGAVIARDHDDASFFEEQQAADDAELRAEASVEDAYAAGDADMDGDNMAVGESVGAPPMEEGAALTDSLLGPPARDSAPMAESDAGPPGAALLPYYVEVEVAPGQVQLLQLNAESPEHARAILRDFRGDPRVLRGPSTEPLQ